MATIKAFNTRFQKINIKATIQEACRLSGFEIITADRNQMKRGEKGDGSKIVPTLRNREYAQIKNQNNPLAGFGTPDLFDTGAFQGGMYIKFGNYNFTLGSDDSKSPLLEKKYNKSIFQLNTTSKKEVVPAIYARLIGSLKQQMRTG